MGHTYLKLIKIHSNIDWLIMSLKKPALEKEKKILLPHTEGFASERYLNALNAVTMESNKDEARRTFTRHTKQTCNNKASCTIELLETGQVLYHTASHSAVTSFSEISAAPAAQTSHHDSSKSDKTLSNSCKEFLFLGGEVGTVNKCLQFCDSCVCK